MTFNEIYDNELDECIVKMGAVFNDRITRHKKQRGFLYDGLFVLLNYSKAEGLNYIEIARIDKQLNNILCKGLITLFDYFIEKYSIIGIGMYHDSPIRPLIKLIDKKYKRNYTLKTNGIIVLEYEKKSEVRKWDSETLEQQKERQLKRKKKKLWKNKKLKKN